MRSEVDKCSSELSLSSFFYPHLLIDRVVSLLMDTESFRHITTNASATFTPTLITAAPSAGLPNRRRLRHRTASLPSLHSANLQKSYVSTHLFGTDPNILAEEKEKMLLRRNVWQERVLFDHHFPVKCFGCDQQPHPTEQPTQQYVSPLLKRPRRMSASATAGPFSYDSNSLGRGDLVGDSNAKSLISCISAVLCSYLIDVAAAVQSTLQHQHQHQHQPDL